MKLDFKSLGIAGAALLAVGPFLPFVSVPLVGAINYFSGGSGDGVFIAALSVVAIAGVFLERPNWLLASAIASAAVLATTLFSVFTGAGDFSRFVSLQIGPLVILAGIVALIFAFRKAPEKLRRKAKPFAPFSSGNRVTSTFAFLGAITCLSAPVAFSYLFASMNGQVPLRWLATWFLVDFTTAALFLLAPIAALVFLFRGQILLSVLSGFLASVLYVQVEDTFWSLRSRELAVDLMPSLASVFLLALIGSAMLAGAAGLRALALRKEAS